jgi:hypothetical protein
MISKMTINIKKKVLGFVCFILFSFIHGQNIRKIDSLWNLYNDVKSHDTDRIKAFFEVAEIYIYDNPDTVIKTYMTSLLIVMNTMMITLRLFKIIKLN